MGERDELDIQEMREELAMTLQWATDYTIESCRRSIDEMTDREVCTEWERQTRAMQRA